IIKRLPPEDQELFAGYVMRHTLGRVFLKDQKPIPAGTTIAQAVDEQRSFLANEHTKEEAEKALSEKLRLEREKAQEAMRSSVTVTVVSKKLARETGDSGIEFDRKLQVVFGFKNNTQKSIAGVKGTLEALDLFGDEISGFAISYDTTIAAGASASW